MGQMKRRNVHRMFGSYPREKCPKGDQWISVVRLWAISRGLNPDRLREPPGDPPRFWQNPESPEEPTDMAMQWDEAIIKLLADKQRQPPSRDELARVRNLSAGDAAKRIIYERDATLPWEAAPPLVSRQRSFFDDSDQEQGPGAYSQIVNRDRVVKQPPGTLGHRLGCGAIADPEPEPEAESA